jgi:glutaredoxin
MGPSLKVTFYTKENCSLCDLAHEMMRDLREDASFELETVDITKSPDAWEAYREMIPVIQVGEEILWGRIDERELRDFLLGKM